VTTAQTLGFDQLDVSVVDSQVFCRGNNVNVIRFEFYRFGNLGDRNLGLGLKDGGEIAFVLRGQVQDDDKRDAAIGCDAAEKFL
jgi:hypothetical protein